MSLTKDFYGLRGFVWWVGIVEDRQDPLRMGNIRVRIIGLHSLDKTKVPTNTLPWAQTLLATNTVKSTSLPLEGDWVLGFFQDGETAQIPVVLGVFNGLHNPMNYTTQGMTAEEKKMQTEAENSMKV